MIAAERKVEFYKALVEKRSEYEGVFYVEAFDEFYKNGIKGKIIKLVEKVLEPYSGRLFEGFSIGKER